MSHEHTMTELAQGFAEPPKDYSPAPIWWWSGERLERGRLRWQLEQLAAGGVYNAIILNLAPSGPLYGCDPDDPPFFSEEWWAIFLGVCADARELGVRLWVYDQIGFSGANIQGDLVRDEPAYAGQWLESIAVEGDGPLELTCPAEGEPLGAALTRLDGGATVALGLRGRSAADASPGRRRLRLIYAIRRGFDYFSPAACAELIDTIHGAYERRAGTFFGDVIVGSFQDELPTMPTWGDTFPEEFRRRAGYDLRPLLGLLWGGDGADARRARADYHAVRAALAEEAFFMPLFRWHQRRGLICGFDQQGPARLGDAPAAVRVYADYLKTHRWFGAPGSDHHGEAKIHSSLAHLYSRPRTWVEAFHSSGWGGTLEETFDWLLPWLRAGANLYNPHAVYYSTRGGWWEWAPPSTCWRQPYWRHYRPFADAVGRMCYLLSQGDHVCDVAVLFPTTTAQSQTTPTGPLPAAQEARDCYLGLVGSMVWFDVRVGALDRDRRDYDVLDDDSLQRAELGAGELIIGAERYRAVVLPGCAALLPATAAALVRFVESGGLLVAVGCAPELSCGPDASAVGELRRLFAAGRATLVPTAEDVAGALGRLPRQVDAPVPTLHRRVGGREVLFVPAAFPRATRERYSGDWLDVDYTFDPGRYAREMTVRLRGARGAPELWDPVSGARRALAATEADGVCEVRVPFDAGPAALLVWPAEGERGQLAPAARPAEEIAAQVGGWDAALEPTLDNRYGDLDRPGYPGAPPAQTWQLMHLSAPAGAGAADVRAAEGWAPAEATFGTYGWWLGPRAPADMPAPLAALADGPDPLGVAGWRPAIYSLSRGIAHDTLHQATLGPKGHVPQEFLDFGRLRAGEAVRLRTTVWAGAPGRLHLALGAAAAKRAWLNGAPLGAGGPGYMWIAPADLRAGANLLEWELTAEEALILRASWALLRHPDRYARPEWLAPGDAPARGSLVRFRAGLDLPFAPVAATIHVGAGVPCRLLVNGVEVGRQGGFDPYDGSPRVQRYTTSALRLGANEIAVEAQDQGRRMMVVVDGVARGAAGEEARLMSGPGWRVRRDDDAERPAALDRRQWIPQAHVGSATYIDVDPAFAHVWRRSHPLPGAAWLEDREDDDTVAPLSPDAFPGSARAEWFRWALPPGAAAMALPARGAARVWVDGAELPVVAGSVALPAPAVAGAVALLRVAPEPGRSGGGVFDGPITYTVGRGPVELRPWAELGLGAYAGGLRYRATFALPEGAADGLALDLGRVRGTAEVWVNGAHAGVRFLSPYRFAIGGMTRSGENVLEVLVCNTLAPYMRAVSPTHYVFPGQELTGLLGPVTVWRTRDDT